MGWSKWGGFRNGCEYSPYTRNNCDFICLSLKIEPKVHKPRLITQTNRVKRPLCSYVLVSNNRGGNMIMQQNIEYLLKEVDDATIWSFILWN